MSFLGMILRSHRSFRLLGIYSYTRNLEPSGESKKAAVTGSMIYPSSNNFTKPLCLYYEISEAIASSSKASLLVLKTLIATGGRAASFDM